VGVGLGAAGSHAPRLSPAISSVTTTPTTGTTGGGSGIAGETANRQPPAGTSRPAGSRTSPAASAGSPSAAVGPLLSQTNYGRYAYQVYPSVQSAETDRALTGFQVTFRRVSPTAEEVVVKDLQDNTTQTATFDPSDRLYFIETRMGDDGVEGETNLGDDGFTLTDAQGHILGQ
jgi:hypothetical protein